MAKESVTNQHFTDDIPSFSLGITQLDNIVASPTAVATGVFDSDSEDFHENKSKHRNNTVKMKKMREDLRVRKLIKIQIRKAAEGKAVEEKDGVSQSQEIKYFVKDSPAHALRMSSSGNDDIVTDLTDILSKEEVAMLEQTCFGVYLNIPKCTFQGQIARCLMTLEVEQDNPNEFWICVNGTVLRFTILEFALITGLKCTGSENDFDFSNAPINRLMTKYFPGVCPVKKEQLVRCFKEKRWGKNSGDAVKIAILYFIHTFIFSQLDDVDIPERDFHLVDNGTYNQFPWGKLAFQALVKSYRQVMDTTKQLYRLYGMPYALQVWFYECCSEVDKEIAIGEGDYVPRILNWQVVANKPQYAKLMDGMFSKLIYRNISPTVNELATLDLPNSIDFASNESVTPIIPYGYEDFTSPLPASVFKRANQESGQSYALPSKKLRTDSKPKKVRTTVAWSRKQPAESSKSPVEPQNPIEKDTFSVDAQHQQPLDADMHIVDGTKTSDETASKQNEHPLLRRDLESLKEHIDNKFLDLHNFMTSQFTTIIQAIKEKFVPDSKDPDSQGNENGNNGPNKRADVDCAHNTDNLPFTLNNADDDSGDKIKTPTGEIMEGHGDQEDVVPLSSWWKTRSEAAVGGGSSGDHTEIGEEEQFFARVIEHLQHVQSPEVDVNLAALKKSQYSAQVLNKTEAEVHRLLMMPLNEVVLPENHSALMAALTRYAASPHISFEKLRALEELKKNLPSLSSDFHRAKKQQEECNRKADKKMFLTGHLTKRRELYDGLEHDCIEIDNSMYSIKGRIAELKVFLKEAKMKWRAIEELKLNCQKEYSAISAELEELGVEFLDSEKEQADSQVSKAEASWTNYKQKITGLRM